MVESFANAVLCMNIATLTSRFPQVEKKIKRVLVVRNEAENEKVAMMNREPKSEAMDDAHFTASRTVNWPLEKWSMLTRSWGSGFCQKFPYHEGRR